MNYLWGSRLLIIAFLVSFPVLAQTDATPSGCPVTFLKLDPGAVSSLGVRVKNLSGKTITGMTFNVALADATEHWKWLHWNFDDTRPLREFGWNKRVKPQAAKTLSWFAGDIYFDHGGGGALVLTSVLFDDGSLWEDPPGRTSCMALWNNSHKKGFSRPVVLPLRQ